MNVDVVLDVPAPSAEETPFSVQTTAVRDASILHVILNPSGTPQGVVIANCQCGMFSP